jgi:hypothetical protein
MWLGWLERGVVAPEVAGSIPAIHSLFTLCSLFHTKKNKSKPLTLGQLLPYYLLENLRGRQQGSRENAAQGKERTDVRT